MLYRVTDQYFEKMLYKRLVISLTPLTERSALRRELRDLRDAVLVKGLQSAIAVLGSGSLVHVAETLHGRDVALDALLWNVQLGYEGQVSTIIETEQHWAAVMTL